MALGLGVACNSSTESDHSPQRDSPSGDIQIEGSLDPEVLARRLAGALRFADRTELEKALAIVGKVRIERRETLVETDERFGQTVRGREEFITWVEESAPNWNCADEIETCRWSGGLVSTSEWFCYGDCCDAKTPRKARG